MLCVKSTAERESLCRYNVCMCGNYELELKHFILPPSLSSFILFSLASSISFPPSFHLSFPSIFSAMYVFPLSLSFLSLSGCQTTLCCYGNEWYSKGFKVRSGSCHLYPCCCCYHWYPTYHLWLLLPCNTGGDLCCHGYKFLDFLIGYTTLLTQ